MNSLKQTQRASAQRKQVYKPILDNPYTDEAHLWPRVSDPALVAELTRRHVIAPLAHARSMALAPPLDVQVGFNQVVEYLETAPAGTRALLFACTRDGAPAVLFAQLPVLARVSACEVTLIQLPRGSNAVLGECCEGHDGLLLVVENAKLDGQFAARLRECAGEQNAAPWLKFAESRLGVLATSVPLTKKAAAKTGTANAGEKASGKC